MYKIILSFLIIILFNSCDYDFYDYYKKKGIFEVSEVHEGYFKVKDNKGKISYKGNSIKVGDLLELEYDSIVNTTNDRYMIYIQNYYLVMYEKSLTNYKKVL